MSLRERALAWLRIPAEPVPPMGDTDVGVFRAAPNFYRYKLVHWFLGHSAAALGLYLALMFAGGIDRSLARMLPRVVHLPWFTLTEQMLLWWVNIFEIAAVVLFLLQAIGSLLLLRLDFEQRWYIVTDRSLRIREGLYTMRERTMTFANLQQVAIHQGPLQRLLGIADLEVSTAGGGNFELGEQKESQHVAYFEGISDAKQVRDLILDRLRQYRDAGLGDADDTHAIESNDLERAAQFLAEEARLLREQLLLPAAQRISS